MHLEHDIGVFKNYTYTIKSVAKYKNIIFNGLWWALTANKWHWFDGDNTKWPAQCYDFGGIKQKHSELRDSKTQWPIWPKLDQVFTMDNREIETVAMGTTTLPTDRQSYRCTSAQSRYCLWFVRLRRWCREKNECWPDSPPLSVEPAGAAHNILLTLQQTVYLDIIYVYIYSFR